MPNLYDEDASLFKHYAELEYSQKGLEAAGEWRQLESILPPLDGKALLDLGCGYGWHCRYAAEYGAARVLGIDSSKNMLAEARARSTHPCIEYRRCGIETYAYPKDTWDIVFSNLALHYIEDIERVFHSVYKTLKPGGIFLFNIEHPVFTAGVGQDWFYGPDGQPQCWPVDDYHCPGPRRTNFLGSKVLKYHHTLEQILMGLLNSGFVLEAVLEVRPVVNTADVSDEFRRPAMLIVRGKK